jgi:hypothetical protein
VETSAVAAGVASATESVDPAAYYAARTAYRSPPLASSYLCSSASTSASDG